MLWPMPRASRMSRASCSKFGSRTLQPALSTRNVVSQLRAAANRITALPSKTRYCTRCNCGSLRLIQIPLLNNYVLSHDQPVRSHLLQRGEHAIHMFIRIYEGDDNWQLASGIDQVAGLDTLPSQESADRVQSAGGKNIFFTQIAQTAEMERLAVPLV